jgi:hypothetical protein
MIIVHQSNSSATMCTACRRRGIVLRLALGAHSEAMTDLSLCGTCWEVLTTKLQECRRISQPPPPPPARITPLTKF